MTEKRTMVITPTSGILPSLYCLMPNQKVIAKVPYMPIMDGDIIKPIKGAAVFSFLAALSNASSCCLANFASAPKATTMRIEEKISNDVAEASS